MVVDAFIRKGLVFLGLLTGFFLSIYIMASPFSIYDQGLFYAINGASGHSVLDFTLLLISEAGGMVLWIMMIIILLIFGGKKRRVGVLLAIVMAISLVLIFVLKGYFLRPRPYEVLSNVNLIDGEDDPSFPSGHVFRAFSGSTLLFMGFGRRASLLLILSFAVAFSRVYMGLHYPTDVMGGASLGTTLAWGISILVKRLEPMLRGIAIRPQGDQPTVRTEASKVQCP